MMKSTKFAIVMLAAFFIFSLLVLSGVLAQIDQDITVVIQSRLTKTLDTPLSFLSLLGAAEITTFFLLIALFFMKLHRSLITLLMFALGTGIELLGKTFLYHPGPPNIFFRYNLEVLFPSAYVQTGHSYPSGHSFRTAFLTVLVGYLIFQSKKLSQRSKKSLSLLCYLFLFLMLLSRVSLGEHWTTDVIGGLLLGAGLAGLSISLITPGTNSGNFDSKLVK